MKPNWAPAAPAIETGGRLLAILSAQVATLRAGWTLVAVRVAGSWIAAAGLLMLGWLLRSFK